MKIVMLCEFYNENLEYQENLLVKYYRKHGHEVTVVTSTFESVFDYYADRHDNSAPARTYVDRGAKIIKLPYRYNILNRLRAYTPINGILEDEKPDLIYVHGIMPNLPEMIEYLKSHPECRMIMDYHADYSNSANRLLSRTVLHGLIRKRFLDRARPYLSRIFPIAPGSTVFLHEVYKVPHSEMELLPLGADTDLAAEVRERQEGRKLREQLGIAEDDFVIFTGGKLAPKKRTEILIAAVKRLSRRPIQLIIAGEANTVDEDYKEGLLAGTAGNPNIRLVGWLEPVDVYRYLDMADLAVFPASQSILWQKAIAMGLPLIVGNSGHQDISYLNEHGNIIMLQKADIGIEQLAEAIESLISDPAKMARMSEGALRTADEHLNWNRLIDRTLRFNS